MFSLSWGAFALLALCSTQVVIALVTVYFHRAASHRAVELHPILLRMCRFLSWFMIAMKPREFAAIHRKHHAKVDTDEDPHSPVRFGVWKVLLQGLPLYRAEAANKETIERYGKGVPVDPWDGFYDRHPNLGIMLFLALSCLLLGWQGVLLWGIHMAWIPFWAAGVVNGLGHHVGYRRFDTEDASTNLVPWGLWIGGEELHNNHHADPSSPKFSRAWYEIDLGWGLIRALQALGLAKPRQVPQPERRTVPAIDGATVRLLRQHRAQWLTELRRSASHDLRPILRQQRFRHWGQFSRAASAIEGGHARELARAKALLQDPMVQAVHDLEARLRALIASRSLNDHAAIQAVQEWVASTRQLSLPRLSAWCDRLMHHGLPTSPSAA